MKRLHSLDALRGVAALCVVLWHWQHFFALSGRWSPGWERSVQPLYWLLKPLYEGGWLAVDLFFALSGYVFFWLYAETVRTRSVGVGNFALLRFSRLYPLHLLTLLVVAVLQGIFRHVTGHFFIYSANDARSFLFNLGLMQGWRPDAVQSFNGPAWSISVEALLYVLFFIIARAGFIRPVTALAVTAFGVVLMAFDFQVARGIIGFFCGGLAWFAVTRIAKGRNAVRNAALVIRSAVLGWAFVVMANYTPLAPHLYDWLNAHAHQGVLQGYAYQSYLLAFTLVLSPLTIAALALHEQLWRVRIYARLSFLGDISYSTYMLQFPLQLIVALLALRFGWPQALFHSPIALILFVLILIMLASLSYRYFERPAQRLIRGRGRSDRDAMESPAG